MATTEKDRRLPPAQMVTTEKAIKPTINAGILAHGHVVVVGTGSASKHSNAVLTSLEQTVTSMTGVTVATLRGQTLGERRKILESQYGHPMKFVSKFPFIGRGNVLRDKIISGADVNALLDKSIR